MKQYSVLGLDPALTTGWSFVEDGKLIASGTMDFHKKRGEGNGIVFLRYRKWLMEFIAEYKPDLIGYEQAHFRGAGTEICLGLQTHIQSSVREMSEIQEKDLILNPVHTGTLKKWAVGHGKAGKEEMKAEASRIADRNITSDDEADAVLVALYTWEILTPRVQGVSRINAD